MVNLVSSWYLLAGCSQETVDTLIEDFLKELVISVFDPKKADTIFEKAQVSHSKPPFHPQLTALFQL